MAKFNVPLVRTVDDSYDIEIGRKLLPVLIEDLKAGILGNPSRYALITDSRVLELYGNDFYLTLTDAGFNVTLYSFPNGEKSKTRETKGQIEDKMIADGFGRDSAVIALGGGVVTDLAGFLAGTFGRGIPFLNYATTLLAAADASVGGKTAIDTPAATNLIGLFNQPQKVYIDIDTWKTLPAREISSGLAETVKHACLADGEFFDWLEENISNVITPEGEVVLEEKTCEHIACEYCI